MQASYLWFTNFIVLLLFSPPQAPTTLPLPPCLGPRPPTWPMSTVAVVAMVTPVEEGVGSTMGWVWWAWLRSTSLHQGRHWAGRQPSMLPARRRWWATLHQVEGRGLDQEGAGPSPQPVPRKERDNTIARSPRNRQRRQPQGRPGLSSVSRSRTQFAGPASALWSGSIL